MKQLNSNDRSVDGKWCRCNRKKYDKHAADCPARKQCESCDRNLFEQHAPGCPSRGRR